MVTRTLTLGAEDAERWDAVVAEAGGDAAAVLRREFVEIEETNAVARHRRLKERDARLTREGHVPNPDPSLHPQPPFVERQVALTADEAERFDYFVHELGDGDVVWFMHIVLIGQDEVTGQRMFERLAAVVSRRAQERGILTDEQSAAAVRRVLKKRAAERDH
jgi:hypothetical protein